jgi:hypothetical protein
MILIDYTIIAEFGHIGFDRELKAEHLGVETGDRFIAHVTDNGVWLKKVSKPVQNEG